MARTVTLDCRSCGADLTERAQEVCFTLTSQPFTITDTDDAPCKPGEICVEWHREEVHFECQERCFYECRDCLAPLTKGQTALVQRRMGGSETPAATVPGDTPMTA
jgi:hypothetical protein